MASFDISRQRAQSAKYISHVPITSDAPTNDDALLFDSAKNQFVNGRLITTTGDQTISTPTIFTGLTRFGTNGSDITRFAFGRINLTAPMLPGQTQTIVVGLSTTTVPRRLLASAVSNTSPNVPLAVSVVSKTTSSVTFRIINWSTSLTTSGTLSLHFMSEV